MTSSKSEKFWFFFQKFKTLWQFDILTKFEDNWTTRTAVSIGEVILPPPPPEFLGGILTFQNRVKRPSAGSVSELYYIYRKT